ncbi:MAG: DUF4175 family protein [Planctomycetota bacterium]
MLGWRKAGEEETASDPVSVLLRGVKTRVKATDLGALALVCLAGLAVYLFAEAVCDRFLILDKRVRFPLLWLFLLLVASVAALLARYARRRVNDLYIAQLVQRGNPELRDMLIAHVSAQSGEAALQPALYDALLLRLRACAPGIRSSGIVPKAWLLAAAYVLGGVGLFFVSSASFSEGSFWTCLKRVVMPWRNILPPTRTQIAGVEPGDAAALQGSITDVTARTQGETPESVRVVFYRDGGWYYTLMEPAGAELWRTRLSFPAGELAYHIAANDTKSDQFTLRGLCPPAVQGITVAVRQPDYTGLGEKELSGGHIDALVGSTARVRATISKPIVQAALQLSWGEEVKMRTYQQPAQPGTAPAAVQVAEGSFKIARSGAYRIQLTDVDGLACQAACDYDVRARVDQPPTVAIVEPDKHVTLEPEDTFKLLVSAQDDYGVAALTLVCRIRNGPEKRIQLGEFPHRRDVLRYMEYKLGDLELLPGDEIFYYVEARDSLQPQPHLGLSGVQHLRVKARPGERVSGYLLRSLKSRRRGAT